MRHVVYDVAISIDGFICGLNGGIDGFLPDGPHVIDYQTRLAGYDTVIMGRKTYEFGYQYGLAPGARAYPHMAHYVFSTTLAFDHEHELNIVTAGVGKAVAELKKQPGSAIYLCGGSAFAGALLNDRLIDRLILKINPVVLGEGRPLFDCNVPVSLNKTACKAYDNGVLLAEYDLNY